MIEDKKSGYRNKPNRMSDAEIMVIFILFHSGGFRTGELEPPYLNRLEGHPYLDTRNYRKGALAFDGGVYPGIGMRLNVYMERLIVLSPDRRLHVIVPPERIPRCGLMKLLTALRGTTGRA